MYYEVKNENSWIEFGLQFAITKFPSLLKKSCVRHIKYL